MRLVRAVLLVALAGFGVPLAMRVTSADGGCPDVSDPLAPAICNGWGDAVP